MGITIKDIAKEASVSIATVSRVINNKSQGVGKETRKKILSIMEKYNYVPSSVARGLVTKKTNIIGLILPDINNPFFPGIVRGAEDAANKYGYNIILCNTDDNEKRERTYIQILKEKCVEGILYTSILNNKNKNVKLFYQHNIPFVSLDRSVDMKNVPFVCTNGEIGMHKIVEYLVQNGHAEIAYISGEKQIETSYSRLQGYKKALNKFGIPINEKIIKYGDYKINSGRACIRELLDSNETFTAVACENDLMAIGALEVLNNRNIKVPQQISITGYDNIFLTNVTFPKLTTIAQPTYDMGYKAVELLMSIINKEENYKKQIVLEPDLVIRDSVFKQKDFHYI
ncbi:LacI family DNA-binding transcriptional regulator [Clostridium rectalis]|uniref:LacI family DNA-binding transcriptional regulator n=1 Tax=Clostridium rectalis TaxID=2040295 RepID=UPI000F63C71C|nr:LacI family DNA-binding transcriptional regulator [Clostridium rectalis]